MINRSEKGKKKVTFGNVKISYFQPEEYFDAWQEATFELEEVVPSPPSSPPSSLPSSPRPTTNPAPKRPLVSDDEDEAPPPAAKKQRVDENAVCDLVSCASSASRPSPASRRVLVACYEVLGDEEKDAFSPVPPVACDFEVFRDEEVSLFPSLSPPLSHILSPLPTPPTSTSDSSTEEE